MTTFDQAADLAAKPPSEVEWEDLLARIEIMPRALRFVLDGVDATVDGVGSILDELIEREEQAGLLLERAAGMAFSSQETRPTGLHWNFDLPERMERFVRYRSRNFAMVQRRGVEVWDWTMTPAENVEISAFQLLAFLARADVVTLTALRASPEGRASTC